MVANIVGEPRAERDMVAANVEWALRHVPFGAADGLFVSWAALWSCWQRVACVGGPAIVGRGRISVPRTGILAAAG
ncbi:hypothetical protein OG203_02720 [Nocardia sp. NBC_01499]|uniref:hypothetical protein n=1 Tax=Nocardia sp. NBC_01499 TaxID=2903597 RepID=UPI00386C5B13